jgi:hypothetical protein
MKIILDIPMTIWYNDITMNSHRKQLTNDASDANDARFFLEPHNPLQRQYEALRTYFVEKIPSDTVARNFGYTPGSFRQLCHQFRHEWDNQKRFFASIKRGPHAAPKRDKVRDTVISLRKKNLSVYDIQQELSEMEISISINAIFALLRDEGFARLPRRRDDERPLLIKPEVAPIANVQELDLSARTFRTDMAGLFLFVPLMGNINMAQIAKEAALPGSKMIPAQQALRSVLALKLVGIERKRHIMRYVHDQGLALFAGLNAIPKRSYLSQYSSSVDRRGNLKLMEVWFKHVQEAGLKRGESIDLDYHTVPANSEKEPLEKHYLTKRSRSQKGVLVFLARDAQQRVLCYANATVSNTEKADEILRFVDFWKKQTGQVPGELVFDSQLTSQNNLRKLTDQEILFITLRRRSKKMLSRIYGTPHAAWRRIKLPSLSRKYRTPKIIDEKIYLSQYDKKKPLRQITITDLGHEEPTILITNNFKSSPAKLITRYAQRMIIENAIAEAIHFFHLDALSSMVGMKVDFDIQITLIASSLYRLLAQKLSEQFRRATAKTIFETLLNTRGEIRVDEQYVVVTIDKRAHNPFLVASGLADQPTPMPWFGNKTLIIRFA